MTWQSILGPVFSSAKVGMDDIKKAEEEIKRISSLLSAKYTSSQPEKDDQFKCFQSHQTNLFKYFKTIASLNPLHAIHVLMSAAKPLGTNAQPVFWKAASGLICEVLENATADTKASAYKHILEHAHKGQLTGFIFDNQDDFNALALTAKDDRLIGQLLAHAAPKTKEFLKVFESTFTALLADAGADRKLSLTKMLCGACNPISGKEKSIPLPAYLEDVRNEEMKHIAHLIQLAHKSPKPHFKIIAGCLQDALLLKVRPTDTINKIGMTNEGKDLLLFRVKGDAAQPSDLFVLASRPRSSDGLGKIFIILSTTDLKQVMSSFSTLGYSDKDKKAVHQMAVEFGLPTPSYRTPDFYQTTQSPFPVASTFEMVSQLTACVNNINSMDEPENRHLFPVQQHQP